MTASKLRYAAYDPPPDPRAGLSRKGITKGAKSDGGRAGSPMTGRYGVTADEKEVMTAGELASMGGSVELTRIGEADRMGHARSSKSQVSARVFRVDILGTRMSHLILFCLAEDTCYAEERSTGRLVGESRSNSRAARPHLA